MLQGDVCQDFRDAPQRRMLRFRLVDSQLVPQGQLQGFDGLEHMALLCLSLGCAEKLVQIPFDDCFFLPLDSLLQLTLGGVYVGLALTLAVLGLLSKFYDSLSGLSRPYSILLIFIQLLSFIFLRHLVLPLPEIWSIIFSNRSFHFNIRIQNIRMINL